MALYSSSMTFSARAVVAPGGSSTLQRMAPLSSTGRNELGVCVKK